MWCGLGVWEGCTTCFKIQKLNERGIYTKYLQKWWVGPTLSSWGQDSKAWDWGGEGWRSSKIRTRGVLWECCASVVRVSHNTICCASVVRKFRIPVVLQDREHGFEILSPKRIRTRFAFLWNSHWDFGKGQRACIFENWHKSKFAQGMCCAKISHNRKCCAKIAESWFFSPVFPFFHYNFIL